jgi:hypothetical protein
MLGLIRPLTDEFPKDKPRICPRQVFLQIGIPLIRFNRITDIYYSKLGGDRSPPAATWKITFPRFKIFPQR